MSTQNAGGAHEGCVSDLWQWGSPPRLRGAANGQRPVNWAANEKFGAEGSVSRAAFLHSLSTALSAAAQKFFFATTRA